MKNNVIKVLKDTKENKQQKYNKLLNLLAEKRGVFAIRAFQVGYTDFKFESLVHEVKKAYEVTDLEIYNYNPDEENDQNQEPIDAGTGEGSQNGTETEVPEQPKDEGQTQQLFSALEADAEAKDGLKIRDEYPFLNDANTPDPYKVLVADKITAWKDFAKKHEALAGILEEGEDSEEKIYEMAKAAVADFQLNADIKAELDYYRDSGKVLGKHPKLNDLRIAQEINELSEADLVAMVNKAQKNASKAEVEIKNQGENEARKKRVYDWKLREKLAAERLAKEYPKKKK